MSLRSSRWKQSQRAELADARAASDASTLSERLGDAVALYLMTVAEVARVSRDREDFARRLEGRDPPAPSLRERWNARRRGAAR